MNIKTNIERMETLAAVVAISCVGISVLLLAPVIVGQVIREYAFSPTEGAYLVSAEMAGIALAALPALWWLNRVNWRRVLTWALLGSAFFLILSAFCTTFATLAFARVFGGLCSGTAVSVGLATCGLRRNTERVFGLCVMGQLLFGALGLAVFPHLMAISGIRGMYLVLAAATLLCLIIVPYVPASSGQFVPQSSASRGSTVSAIRVFQGALAIFGLYLFYVSLNGVWTFLERIGVGSALPGTHVDYMLSMGSLMGIAGAAAAAFLSTRWGRKLPPGVGVALILIAFFLLRGKVSAEAFLLAVCLFKFAWTFALPYFLGGIAGADRRGRMIVIGNIFVGGGLASGPALAAQLTDGQGFDRLLVWASLAMLASFVFALPVLLGSREPIDAPQAIRVDG